MTKGTALIGKITKIARNKKGHLAGASGDAVYNQKFIRWFLAGEKGLPPVAKDDDNHTDRGLIFRNGEIELYEAGQEKFIITADYFAVGSGCDFAIGAMHAGANAFQAVVASCKHDPNTRGPITVLRAKP